MFVIILIVFVKFIMIHNVSKFVKKTGDRYYEILVLIRYYASYNIFLDNIANKLILMNINV